MDAKEQLEYGRYKAQKEVTELEAEMTSLGESISAALNPYVYPEPRDRKVGYAAQLMRKLEELHERYRQARERLDRLSA